MLTQDVLAYITTRTLPYHLYADECELLVFEGFLTSVFSCILGHLIV